MFLGLNNHLAKFQGILLQCNETVENTENAMFFALLHFPIFF